MQPPPYQLEEPAAPNRGSWLHRAGPESVPTTFEVPPLPENVTVEQAYSDFIKYLFDNSKVRHA